ncbi:hypothetical protein EPN44_14415 [bacterium]|nr:MAG: hypothetical protein EPN44_14415 [bacterium]
MIGISILLLLSALAVCGIGIYVVTDGLRDKAEYHLPGVLEKVPYRKLIADGVVELTDGKLLTAWEVSGPDSESLTVDDYRRFASDLNDVYASRGEACQVNYDVFREAVTGYPSGRSDHRDPTTAVMHGYREQQFERAGLQYANRNYYSLSWTPPSAMAEAISGLAVAAAGGSEDHEERFRRSVRAFEEQCKDFEASLPSRVTFRRLGAYEHDGALCDELLEFLHRCVTTETMRIRRPAIALVQGLFTRPISVGTIIADQDVAHANVTRVGSVYQQVVSVETFRRGGTLTGAFDTIAALKLPLHISLRAILLDTEYAKRQMDSRFAKHMGNVESPLSRLLQSHQRRDATALRRAEAAEQADTSGEKVRWVHWNLKVVLASEDLATLQRAARSVKKALAISQFGARIEDVGNSSALAATWPGESTSDRSGSMVDTVTIADVSALCGPWRGPDRHPNPSLPADTPPTLRALGTGNTPMDVYDAVEDVSHLGIVGETGGGKSLTMTGLTYCDRAQNDNIDHYIFDQGRSAERYVRAAGGVFATADPADAESGLNPFYRVEDELERHRLELWLTPMFHLQGQEVSPARQEMMQKALRLLAKSSRRSMSLYQAKLATMDPDLAGALTFWTIRGPMGYLLDSEDDHFRDASLQCFELERLMRFDDERATAPYISLLFDRIRDRADRPGRRVRVVLDEPQDYFKHPIFAGVIAAGYDRGRKSDWGMRMATQRPEQFMKSVVAGPIIDATKTWLFTPSDQANKEFKPVFKERFGLTDEACDMIATSKKKRHVILWQDKHLAQLNMRWTPEELLMLGGASKDEKRETADLRSRFPSHWPAELYRRHGFSEAAARWVARAKELGLLSPGFELAA